MEPIVFDIYYVFKMASHAAYLFFFFCKYMYLQ